LLPESKSNALEETKSRFTSNTVRDKSLLVLKLVSTIPHTSLILAKKIQSHSLFLISATKLTQIEEDASYTPIKLPSMSLVQLTSSQNFLPRLLSNQLQAWLSCQVISSRPLSRVVILSKIQLESCQKSTAQICQHQSRRDIRLKVLPDFHVMTEKLPILSSATSSSFTALIQIRQLNLESKAQVKS